MSLILLISLRQKSGLGFCKAKAELTSLQLQATPLSAVHPFAANSPSSVPPTSAISPAPTGDVTVQAPSDVPSSPSTLSEQIWNKAYDDLKRREPKIIDAYERILSQELIEDNSGRDLSRTENTIEQADIAKRWSQMEQLIQARLEKTEREYKFKQAVGEVMQHILSVKDAVSSALQAVPQAALAWTGVCFALQVDSLFTNMPWPMLMSEDVCKSYD